MTALTLLTRTEARLYLRDPGTAVLALALPAVLVLLVGRLMPGMRDVDAASGLRGIDVYLPVVLAMSIATVAVSTFPATFGTYRERGVLRRLATTPLPAGRLLLAELIVSAGAVLAAAAAAVAVGVLVLDVPAPRQPLLALLAFVLGAVHMLALGAVIAARVRTAARANGWGMLLYFPLLFAAGVWLPGPLMPEGLREVVSVLPLGAAAQALTEGWFGSGVPLRQLLAMAVWTGVLVPLAARLFRWT